MERYPSPLDAKALGEKRLGAFLARHGYCGRKTPAQPLAKLRAAPHGRAGEGEIEARRAIVLALVAALRPLVSKISELTSEIDHRVRAHPDGQIFLSLFKDPKSVLCAAALLAEIGDCRARYPSAEALAADAGMSPVAVESGKRKVATFRWGCDKRLRDATSTLADATRHCHPWAADRYATARARRHDHPRAIRTLGRAWCRVICAAGKTVSPTTPPATTACNSTSPSRSPTAPAPGWTSKPPSGWPAQQSPPGRRAAPSAKRLTASRHLLPTRRVDTGRLTTRP